MIHFYKFIIFKENDVRILHCLGNATTPRLASKRRYERDKGFLHTFY